MTTINSYVRGALVRATADFSSAAGQAVDPTTVRFRVMAPDGTVTTYVHGVDAGLVKDTTGSYHADVDAAADGVWHYRWEGEGANQAAAESQFTVIDGVFA